MNQHSLIPFGTDATKVAGYLVAANDRLGNVDLTIENTGANSLYFQVKEQTNPSGAFVNVGAAQTIVPGGTKTLSLSGLLSSKLGFFGSGETTANVGFVIRNKANLRGASYDILVAGRRGFGFDPGYNQAAEVPTVPGFNTLV